MTKSSILKGYIMAISSAVIYGLMPFMTVKIYETGVNAITLVALRNLLALPALALFATGKGKGLSIPKKALLPLSAIAFFGMFMTPLLLFCAYNFIPSSAATVIHFIYPAFVAVGGILFLKERPKAAVTAGLVLCIVGVALFYDPAALLDPVGALLAIGSGVTCAIYVLLLSRFKYKSIPAATVSFYVAAIGGSLTLIAALLSGQLSFPTSIWGWGFCLLFSLLVTVGAVLLYQQSIFHIGGTKASILSALEPITSVVVGVFILQEGLSPQKLIGSLLVILAGILPLFSDLKKTRSK